MDFKTLLTNRRSIRDFQDRNVPLSVVKEIIQDTCLAPTASNRQPCRFVIIQDREWIKKLSTESKHNLLADLARNPEAPLKQYEAALRDEKFNVFYNAPCLVLVIGPRDVFSLDVDCGLTAAYFMFSAVSRGLGTCWIGAFLPESGASTWKPPWPWCSTWCAKGCSAKSSTARAATCRP